MLLCFAGVLVAIYLRSLSDLMRPVMPLSAGLRLMLVVALLLGLFSACFWWLAPDVANQLQELRSGLPEALDALKQRLLRADWAQPVADYVSEPRRLMPARRDLWTQVTGLFSSTLSVLANLFIVGFLGLYLAAEPQVYMNGLTRLFPKARRPRIRQVMEEVAQVLQWWLLGKVASMLLVGVATAAGLWLLDIPLALTLGLVAALLTFIPNIGPILSVVPAALIALAISPAKALMVVGLYVGIQFVESYLLTPLVQRRTVSLPPALTIVAQVLMGISAGGLGLLIATPLTAATLVMVKMLYLEDVLQENPKHTEA